VAWAADLSTLSRTNGTAWPTEWPTRSEHWPKPPDPWTPTRTSQVVVVCLTTYAATTGWTTFATIEQAQAAEAQRAGGRCRPECLRQHTICFTSATGLHIEGGSFDPEPVPQSLAAAIRQAYPRPEEAAMTTHPKHAVPKPPPTPPEEPTVPDPDDELTERMLQDEREAGRLLYRLGIQYRAAYAHRRVQELKANGASELEVAGAEMVAAALADAALTELAADTDGPSLS
jgi:hypothetical protein